MMPDDSRGNGALGGLRILDLSRILAGPYCTMLLGDYGAEIIKVEQPGMGDGSREWGPPWEGPFSAYFLSANRNKRSITLNLQTEEGQQILRRLAARTDVLLENFKPETMAGWGLDYESLAEANPALIYCAITGYGQTGPYRERPGYDFMIQAQGGLMSITGPAEGPPYKVGVAVVDITAGLYAATAILAALHARSSTGLGQFIDVALLDAQLGWLVNVAHNYFASAEEPGRYGNAHPNIVPYQSFPTADGYLALAVGSDSQYRRLCEVTEQPDLWTDERFQTNAGRVQYRQEVVSRLEKVLQTKPTDHWVELLIRMGVPAAPINDLPAILNDPQVAARQMVQTVESEAGPIKQLGPVARLSRTPAQIQSAPPLLGAHTESVLQELGYNSAQIKSWREQGVL